MHGKLLDITNQRTFKATVRHRHHAYHTTATRKQRIPGVGVNTLRIEMEVGTAVIEKCVETPIASSC